MASFDSQSLNNVTQTLINVTDSAGGTSIPPKQFGEFRIPFVKNLRLGPQAEFLGGTQYTLLWDEPDTTTNVSHYNVYITGLLSDNSTPLGPYSSQSSPATLRVVASQAAVLTFLVQTQLNNGNVSDLERSPSCTAHVSAPTITGGSGGATISASAIIPGSANQIMSSNTSGGTSEWRSIAFPNINQIAAVYGAGTITLSLADTIKPKVYAENTVNISADYTCLSTDSTVFVDASAGAVNVILPPSPIDGQTCTIKKTDNGAFIVNLFSPATIETGAAPSSSRACVVLRYNVANNAWYVISKY